MQYFPNQIAMEPVVIDSNVQPGPIIAPPMQSNIDPNLNNKPGPIYPPMLQQNFEPMTIQDDPLASLMRSNKQQQIQTEAPNPSKPAVYQIPISSKNNPMSSQNIELMVLQDPLTTNLMRSTRKQQIQPIAFDPGKPDIFQIPISQKSTTTKAQNTVIQQKNAKKQDDLQQFFVQQAGKSLSRQIVKKSVPAEVKQKGCC